MKYRDDETDNSIFLQNDSQDLLLQLIFFVKSRRKKINDLFEKSCFEIVSTTNLSREIKMLVQIQKRASSIIHARLIDSIKLHVVSS